MVWIGECHAAVARRTLPPGTSARGSGDLAWLATPAPQAGEQQFAAKKNGVLCRAPLSLALKNYRFFAAFFFAPLAAFFAIGSLLRISDSASDGPLGRHNGWAEPSTLIPDVDYG